jgi:hypothetical protein
MSSRSEPARAAMPRKPDERIRVEMFVAGSKPV